MESVDGNQGIVNFSSDQREQGRRAGGRSLIATWIELKQASCHWCYRRFYVNITMG